MNLRDAINEMLLSLNELPLDIADAIEDVPISVVANQTLEIVKKRILSAGWDFNTTNIELVPNTDGYIPIPLSFLSLDGGDAEPNLTVRDWKLFDKAELTYKFEDNKQVEVIEDMPFDDIPYNTASYVVAIASLEAYIDIIGDESGIAIRRERVRDAKIEALREDANKQDGNLLQDAHATTVLDRTSI